MNQHCPDIELELADFAAGDLAPAAADPVARHLAGCADCRGELERELRLRESLATLPLAAAPASLGRLPVPAAPRRFGLPLPGAAALVAAALLLALLGALPRLDGVPQPDSGPVYTADQVASARRDAAWTLVLAARILERSEKNALADVFGQRLPRAVAESLRSGPSTPEGGRG